MPTALLVLLLLGLSTPALAQPLVQPLTEVAGFFARDAAFTGGVQVALCGLDASGNQWVVTAPGPGGPPQFSAWLLTPGAPGGALGAFAVLAYHPDFAGGVQVACRFEPGGMLWIMTGAGPGGGPHVRVFTIQTAP